MDKGEKEERGRDSNIGERNEKCTQNLKKGNMELEIRGRKRERESGRKREL